MFNSDRFNLGKRYYGPPSPFSSSWCAARLVSQKTLKSASDNIAYFFYVADSPNQYTLTMMIVFLTTPSDPTVWHHVVRFSRSFLLDESNPGFQQRSVTTALEPMEVVSLVPVGLSQPPNPYTIVCKFEQTDRIKLYYRSSLLSNSRGGVSHRMHCTWEQCISS